MSIRTMKLGYEPKEYEPEDDDKKRVWSVLGRSTSGRSQKRQRVARVRRYARAYDVELSIAPAGARTAKASLKLDADEAEDLAIVLVLAAQEARRVARD
jgi:hypothetical protein